MNHFRILVFSIIVLLLISTACNSVVTNSGEEPTFVGNESISEGEKSITDSADIEHINGGENEAPDAGDLTSQDPFTDFLIQIKSGELDAVNIDSSLEWARGYFFYYGSLDSIRALAIDQIIYHSLEAHRRLDTGEVTDETISLNDRNLLQFTQGLDYNSQAALTDQVGQTAEVREAILARIVEDQRSLSPQEAIDSNNIIGVFAPPVAEAIGGKFLVYSQEFPDADFEFLGVVLAVDAAGGGSGDPYNFKGWENLIWLGDATGPFWNDLPTGVSEDPANTSEPRPGVFLVNEKVYTSLITNDTE